VTFRGFTAELTAVLSGFATSPHGFIIKNISVQPANSTTDQTQGAPPPAPMPGRTQMVLDEQMLRVTMMIEVVKLTPRS
jgi:hypothetical protein